VSVIVSPSLGVPVRAVVGAISGARAKAIEAPVLLVAAQVNAPVTPAVVLSAPFN